MNYIQELLLKDKPLFISAEEYRQIMVDNFPLSATVSILDIDMPNYKTYVHESLVKIKQYFPDDDDDNSNFVCNLTDDFTSQDIPDRSIAYHRIFGMITADCSWRFSSKQLEKDLLDAENNPLITCHFLHINSGGGEAWYLDRLDTTFSTLKKPIVGLCENACASAGYRIGCHAQKLYCLTLNDLIGCLGTMVSFYDFSEYYKKLGINKVTVKSEQSDLKNKTFDDLEAGKPQDYVKRFLNPLTEQFISEVKKNRSALKDADPSNPVLRGETYTSEEAQTMGLTDGIKSFVEVVAEAKTLGDNFYNAEALAKRALSYI